MDELSTFIEEIKTNTSDGKLSIDEARYVVSKINEFLYTKYHDVGTTKALEQTFSYFSDFHKYWENHYKEILNVHIDETQCEKVAEALHDVFINTNGSAFKETFDTQGLPDETVCRIRFLTANQDFRGSRNFSEFAEIYSQDPAIFDEEVIFNDPENFLKALRIQNLSQSDKRLIYAKRVAEFLTERHITPYDIPKAFHNDVAEFKAALISFTGAGYGNKKTDMFIRDMVVLGIWKNVYGFDKIDVASDINTVKVALRTGILQTAIPLVSSFIDIFCYQYGYIDEMNAKAWRKVWEIWMNKFPEETISSPCLMDYFVYNVVGRQFCKERLYIFECNEKQHTFKWHSYRNTRCQICYENGEKNISAHITDKLLPCSDKDGRLAIRQTDFVKSLPRDKKINQCPFADICNTYGKKGLQPPKSISIKGRTGWIDAYADKDNGGGGLMA